MTTHDAHALSREEVLVGIDRPTAPALKTISLLLALIGLVVFVIGLFVQPDRAWQALLVNWLYFTSISPKATTSRNTFVRGQLGQVMRSVLGPVHATERSYRPFATNRSPSSARNLSDVLCTFTIELKSVVAPQFRS